MTLLHISKTLSEEAEHFNLFAIVNTKRDERYCEYQTIIMDSLAANGYYKEPQKLIQDLLKRYLNFKKVKQNFLAATGTEVVTMCLSE